MISCRGIGKIHAEMEVNSSVCSPRSGHVLEAMTGGKDRPPFISPCRLLLLLYCAPAALKLYINILHVSDLHIKVVIISIFYRLPCCSSLSTGMVFSWVVKDPLQKP